MLPAVERADESCARLAGCISGLLAAILGAWPALCARANVRPGWPPEGSMDPLPAVPCASAGTCICGCDME